MSINLLMVVNKNMEKYLQIGKIVNTHGINGELKVIPLTDDAKRYEKLKWVYVDKGNLLLKYHIESVKFLKSFVILKFKEVADMNEAEKLKQLYIKVDRENAVKLPKDSYFICDLIGVRVFDINLNCLGILKDVLKTGSNDVYVVSNEANKEILIPALKSVVKEICIKDTPSDSKIIVSLPEGLVDDEI